MNNVIGLHIVGDNFNPTRLGRPAVVKLVDPSVDFKRRVRAQIGQDALLVVRFYEAEQRLDTPSTDARNWYSRHVAQMLAMSDPMVAFEGYNEIGDGQASAYAQFEATRLGLMHAAGFRAVVGNFSVGTPDLPTWYTYRPMLDAMKEGDFLGLHEYWPDAAGIDNRWWCGRWDLVPEIRMRPIIVTECGRDQIKETKPDGTEIFYGQPGWKLGAIGAEQYVAEIQKYAAVLGDKLGVVFTGGALTSQWEPYSVNDIWEGVTKMYTTETPTIPAPPPAKYRVKRWLRYWDRWRVSQAFGVKNAIYAGGVHNGTDMVRTDGGTHGAVLLAPFDGVVDVVSWRDDRGWYLYLHDETRGIEFFACHLAVEPWVAPGDRVKAGQVVAHVGNTGRLTTGAHLHAGLCRVDAGLNIIEWLDLFGPRAEIVQ